MLNYVINLLENANFKIVKIDEPVPGTMTVKLDRIVENFIAFGYRERQFHFVIVLAENTIEKLEESIQNLFDTLATIPTTYMLDAKINEDRRPYAEVFFVTKENIQS